jgi:Fe-S-cluster containining protein
MNTYADQTTPGCRCHTCRSYCKDRPGWPTVEEARGLIVSGFAPSLGIDFWVGATAREDVEILAPAIEGHEGRRYGFYPYGRCTFLDNQGNCAVHNSGFKPWECRQAIHPGGTSVPSEIRNREHLAETWASPKGKALVRWWKQHYGSPPDEEQE